jgi:hypothetical protein
MLTPCQVTTFSLRRLAITGGRIFEGFRVRTTGTRRHGRLRSDCCPDVGCDQSGTGAQRSQWWPVTRPLLGSPLDDLVVHESEVHPAGNGAGYFITAGSHCARDTDYAGVHSYSGLLVLRL